MPSPAPYTPPGDRAEWESLGSCSPRRFEVQSLAAAAAFAEASESKWPASFYYPDGRYVGIVEWNEKGPWSEVAGMVRARGRPAGLVLDGGRIAAEWGDTRRADMTFSVAKSYLAILAGLAVADGHIADLDQPVAATVSGPWFQSAHNARITWRHLLQQSSEWDGVLWEKSDQVDHYRQLGAGADNSRKGDLRPRQPPGTFYEYNDVRVNLLALALLMRFKRPLPEVLRERIMDPIGASGEWEWHGYRTSWLDVDGRRVQSVSGGAHWGGGMLISARDQARLGLLVARGGTWGGRQLLPPAYVAEMLKPSPTNAAYGFLWWLNRGKGRRAAWSEACVSAMGAGTNLIWVDPGRDIVAVLRWIDKSAVDGFLDRLAGAMKG
ncbi:MAG: serine hydrolase [Hyphomicrobiaceae bacterium]|nr:serine hydrolase [Hyphomicrobiaceae bacterium]